MVSLFSISVYKYIFLSSVLKFYYFLTKRDLSNYFTDEDTYHHVVGLSYNTPLKFNTQIYSKELYPPSAYYIDVKIFRPKLVVLVHPK